jgi:hypothetical protein
MQPLWTKQHQHDDDDDDNNNKFLAKMDIKVSTI